MPYIYEFFHFSHSFNMSRLSKQWIFYPLEWSVNWIGPSINNRINGLVKHHVTLDNNVFFTVSERHYEKISHPPRMHPQNDISNPPWNVIVIKKKEQSAFSSDFTWWRVPRHLSPFKDFFPLRIFFIFNVISISLRLSKQCLMLRGFDFQ